MWYLRADMSRMSAYLDVGELTWRRPSPTERSRTPAPWLSGRRAALRPCWQEDGRPRRRPSNVQAARSGNERFLRTGWDASDSTPDQCDRGSPGRRRRTEMKAGKHAGGDDKGSATAPSSTVTALRPGRRWQPPSSSYPDCLGAGHVYWCHQQTGEGPYRSPGGWRIRGHQESHCNSTKQL